MIVCIDENSILFYHPETGVYNIKTYVQQEELKADVVFDRNGDFELNKWYQRKNGKMFSVTGEIKYEK